MRLFNRKVNWVSVIELFVVIGLFIFISYLVSRYFSVFDDYLNIGYSGMVFYVFFLALSIVIAPVASVPLIPIASSLWGVIIAGSLSVLGWLIGAMIAFIIAREYGVGLIKKIVSVGSLEGIEKMIGRNVLFWNVVLLRMFFPVDLLSYALGLFSKMSYRDYFFATFIGIIPFAFIFAYLGIVPFSYQIIGFLVIGIVLLCFYIIRGLIR